MKFKTYLLVVFFLFSSCAIFAQLSLDTRKNLPTKFQYKKMAKYRTVLNLRNRTNVRGLLFQVTNEKVILIPVDKRIDDYSHFVSLVKNEQIAINIPFIYRVGTRKKGKSSKDFIIGGAVGLALTVLAAISAEEPRLLTTDIATIPILTGGILGMLLGSFSKSHKLNNKTEIEKLREMAIITNQ